MVRLQRCCKTQQNIRYYVFSSTDISHLVDIPPTAEQETVMHLEPRFQHIFRDENGKIVHMTVQLFAKVMTDLGSHLDSDEVDDMISIMQKDGEKAKIISVDSFAMFLQNHHPNH